MLQIGNVRFFGVSGKLATVFEALNGTQLVLKCFCSLKYPLKLSTCFVGINLQWKFVAHLVAVSTVHLHVVRLFVVFSFFVATLALSHNMCINSYVLTHPHHTLTRHGFRCGTCIYINYTRILVHTENVDGKLTKIGLLPCISTIELTMLNFDYAICWKSTKFSSTLIA